MNNRLFKTTVLVVIIYFSYSVFAQPTLFNLVSHIKSFHADFKQINQFQGQNQTLIGQLDFIAPSQLKITQTQPFEQVILINADQTLIYDIDLAQLTKRKTQLQHSPIDWLFDLEKLKTTQYLGLFNELEWYQLKTKNDLIQISFKNNILTQIRFQGQGYQSKIIFSNQGNVLEKQLSLKIPDNIDVIDFTK